MAELCQLRRCSHASRYPHARDPQRHGSPAVHPVDGALARSVPDVRALAIARNTIRLVCACGGGDEVLQLRGPRQGSSVIFRHRHARA